MTEHWITVANLPTPFQNYRITVEGLERRDGTWAGRIIFVSGAEVRRTGQETSQPNREALAYWATGLEEVYLEGALERAA